MQDLNAADESWEILQQFLPDNLEDSAHEHGAFRRARGEIQSAEVLLRLLLLHVAGGLSLEQSVVRAREHKLVNISAVGLFKRLRNSGPWLVWLTEQLVKRLSADWDDALWKGRPIRVLDATDIEEPGPTGTDWRLHYSLRLPQLSCDFLELTDVHGGETLKRLPVDKGDIVLPAWLIDSSSPHRLWFCRVQRFDRRRSCRDGLLHQPVEQLAAVPGKTPVETESELVEIRL